MRKIFTSLLPVVIFLDLACTVNRHITPSSIGLVRLQGFSPAIQTNIQDTMFQVYRNDAEFASAFTASSASTKKPDFNGQMAIAVITKAASSIFFDKAEVAGNTVNLYLQSCTPSVQSPCQPGNLFLATIPKVGSAKNIAFYVDSVIKYTFRL